MGLAAATLLVEDEQAVAETYLKSFGDEGLVVDHAATWDAALAMFRVAGYELVIADYNLPGSKQGLQLLLTMKRLVPHSRLILISGAMSPQAEVLAGSIDFIDGFYAKRVGLADVLLREVQQVADRAGAQTDWRKFGAGYLADPKPYQEELDRIDQELNADVARRV
jgi:DNA-binding NtrC family response regulator